MSPVCNSLTGFYLYFIFRWICIQCSKGLLNWSFLKTLITLHGNGLYQFLLDVIKWYPGLTFLNWIKNECMSCLDVRPFWATQFGNNSVHVTFTPLHWVDEWGVSGWVCHLHSPGFAVWDIWTFRVHHVLLASFHGLKEYDTQGFKLFILIIGLYVPVPGQTSVILVHN